jgi:signal transduction histidine kinase
MSQPSRARLRDRVVDVSCVTISVLLAVLFVAGAMDVRSATGAYLVSSVVLTAVGCVAIWWRRRWPLGVALLLLPIGAYTEFAAGASLISVFTVAVHRPARVAWALVAAGCVASIPYSILRPDPALEERGADAAGLSLMGVLLTLVLLLPLVGWGAWVRARRRKLDGLRERAERAEAEATAAAERIRDRERARIAREMHDVLAHRITLVSLHAGALEVRPDMGAGEVATVAGTIRSTAHEALEDLREILGLLRAGADGAVAVRPQLGVGDIDELVGECRAAGVAVELESRLPDVASLPAPVSRTAYRVVQEGLTNARKHAPERRVRVCLARSPEGELHVRVRNPLTGARPAPADAVPGSRSGLLGLSERVSLAGGRIDYGARRGADGGAVDFSLEVWLPWPT